MLANATVVLDDGHGLSRAIRIICSGAENLIHNCKDASKLPASGVHYCSFQPNNPTSDPQAHSSLYRVYSGFRAACVCTCIAPCLYSRSHSTPYLHPHNSHSVFINLRHSTVSIYASQPPSSDYPPSIVTLLTFAIGPPTPDVPRGPEVTGPRLPELDDGLGATNTALHLKAGQDI